MSSHINDAMNAANKRAKELGFKDVNTTWLGLVGLLISFPIRILSRAS